MLKSLELIGEEEDFNDFQEIDQICLTYFKYLSCVNDIAGVYELIQHPQKRKSVASILEHAMGRLLELKSEIVSRLHSECPNISEEQLKAGYSSETLELKVPLYFSQPRDSEAGERRAIFNDVISRYGASPDETPGEGIHLTLEDAVRVIQVHERARQGQARARLMKEIKLKKEEAAVEASRASKRHYNIAATFINKMEAATVIQKVWRGYKFRKYVRNHRAEEHKILGMIETNEECNDNEVKRWKERRRQVLEKMTGDYDDLVEKTRKKLNEQTENVLEKMLDEKRDWYTSCLENEGVLPDPILPDEEQRRKSVVGDDEFTRGMGDLTADESKGSKGGQKKNQKSKKPEKKKPQYPSYKLKKPGQKEDDAQQSVVLPKPKPSKFVDSLLQQLKLFQETWGTDLTEQMNTELNVLEVEKAEMDIFEDAIKDQVNAIVNNDIETLKQAVDKDKGKKGKKSKPSKKTKRGAKKGKKEKDLTPDRTLESLVEELVQQEIIKELPIEFINDAFICDPLGHQDFLSRNFIENLTYFDIQQSIKEFCILPLGSEIIHKNGPLVRSILLVGPKGNGKKAILNEVCKATDSVLFDLTATNIAGKYQGKAGLNMLMHLVNKVSRLLQPAIIYVAEAEKTFLKKVPKSDRTDPKKLKKDLPKLVRGITAEDRILVIGITDAPFESDIKSLCSTYQKIIYFPKPDYAHRKALWKEVIIRKGGEVKEDLDLSTLTKLSDGFSAQTISQVVKQVLTTRRVSQMARYPLTLIDFINTLHQFDPIFRKEEEMFQNWLCKTSLGKKKLKLLKKQSLQQVEDVVQEVEE